MKFVLLEEFGKAFVPRKVRPKLRSYLLKAGVEETPYKLFGGLFYLSLAITAIIYIVYVLPYLNKTFGSTAVLIWTFIAWITIQLAIIGVIMLGIYSYLDMVIFNRTKKIEEILPEFLKYISENLRGGMSFDRALFSSIRPEYGILSNEVSLVAKRVMSGEDVEDALEDFMDKYDSPMLKRSFGLVIEGMKGGAPLADLMDRIQADLVETMELKSEMAATNSTYVIFLTSIVLFIAPGLFGLSFNLLLVFQKIAGTLSASTAGSQSSLPIRISSIQVDPEGFKTFSMIALGIIAVFTSMIISIIRKGNVKQGIKYIPVFAVVSISMYIIFRLIFLAVFGGLVGVT
ncbi:MAG: type II secretion system protein F GspF2 [archaeon GW2011_AR3]|nr:MAG: type II secretion system protein F GspF2 [archaeon GW2011_AR3]MBS3110073.1 type II secretion system F family protein [Candidatus Woesearchaeota archaeon]